MSMTQIIALRISTHAPRTGSDLTVTAVGNAWIDFNPRSPHGERRSQDGSGRQNANISTHAPRTGSDSTSSPIITIKTHFNPRSPHGERQSKSTACR